MTERSITFRECYKEWRKERIMYAEAGVIELATVHIDDLAYETYYKHAPFACEPVNEITTAQLNEFLIRCIAKYNASHDWKMTRKCFDGVARVGKKVFRYAYENRIVEENPFDRVKSGIAKSLPAKTGRKKDEEQVLTEQECRKVRERLQELHEKRPDDVRPLALMLYMHIGARRGEPVALTWDDVGEDAIRIHDSVHFAYHMRDDGTIYRQGEKLKGKTKTGAERFIPITPEIRYILDEVRKAQRFVRNPVYVFEDFYAKRTSQALSLYLSKHVMAYLGIRGKGITSLRKTVASQMARLTPDRNSIAKLLGHSTFVDECYYQYNLSTQEEQIRLLTSR